MLYLRSFLFTVVLFLSSLVTGTIVAILAIFPFGVRYRFLLGWANFILGTARVVCGLDYRVAGKENIPDENCVAYLKHQSAWETIAQLVILPRQCIVLKRSLLFIPFVGWGFLALRSIAIDRGKGHSAVSQVVSQGLDRLKAGFWVTIFPEGTRMAPGQTRRYGISGALLASEAGKPIVPVAHNAGDLWPRRGLIKYPGTVEVRIGAPIATRDRSPREINDEAQGWIESQMREISANYRLKIED